MPTLSRLFIRAGLLYFVGGLAVMVAGQIWSEELAWLAFSAPVYFHWIMVGWITQIIIGVSYWMFPAINRDRPRGAAWLGWAVFVLLNGGLIIRGIVEPFSVGESGPWISGMLIISALCQWLAGCFYVALIWPRIKGK